MYAGQYAPCVADGRVVWVGCLGQMHCVDATSGEHLWTQSTGGIAELDARYRRYLLDVGKIGGRGPSDPGFKQWKPTRDAPLSEAEQAGSRGFGWDSATRVIDGVAVANTRDGDAVAHDLATGAQLWRRRGALTATRGPLVWRQGETGHVLTVNRSQIACLDPRTGAERWTAPCGGGSYNGHTPAIHGDRLIATGPETGGFACWRLGPTGAEKLWELPKLFISGYESPLIYRAHLWISRLHTKKTLKQWDELAARWPQAFTDEARQALLNADGRPAFRNLLACVDLADGAVQSCVGMPMLDHASLVAGDGRLVLNTYGLTLMDADPANPRILDRLDVQNIWCTTPVLVDGRVYFRGTRHLVNCWDLRQTDAKGTAAQGDWRNALIRLDLAGIRQPSAGRRVIRRRGGTAPMPAGEDLRLHLRTRDGAIRQAWMTYGPAHADPEQVWTDELTLADGRLQGRLRCQAVGLPYHPQLDVDLRGAEIAGSYQDEATGESRKGAIGGSASRIVRGNATVALRLRREWNGGMNPGHQTFLDFRLQDGVGVEPRLYTRGDQSGTWTPTFKTFDVTYRDGVLTGDLRLTCESHGHAKSGDYQLTFAAPVSCNRFADSFRVWRDGTEVTPHNPTNRQVWGSMEPPEDEDLTSDNALYEISLDQALDRGKALRVFLEYRDGELASAKADSPRFCASAHTIDTGGLALEDGRIHGDLAITVRSDGFVPLCDQPCRYTIDLRLGDDGAVSGSYAGVFALRTPRRGPVTGVFITQPSSP